MSYYIINEISGDSCIWPILCSSFEQALGHVLNKITEMNKEFRKENPQWNSVDYEYSPGRMEDTYSVATAKDKRGVMVANFSDYDVQFFIKEVCEV